jgi:GAF domain-containing protein
MIQQDKKTARYSRIYAQLKPLLEKSPSFEAQLVTINAVLYHKMPQFFWVGFYRLTGNRLLVGPYQGPLACQELEYSHGVCWKSILERTPLIVEDVHNFPDHIACDSRSKSEIVIPVQNSKKEIIGVLDVDSDKTGTFDRIDEEGLKKILELLYL